MIIKLIFVIFILFILKLFIVKFNFKDYFNITLSLLLLFFSYLYILSNGIFLIIPIFIISLSLIIYSYFKIDSGDSSIIILNGNINFKNLFKNNYTLSSLFKDIRKNKISFLDDNICGILKDNELVFYSKNIRLDRPISIIINGSICLKELYTIGKNKKWLNRRVEENNCNIDDIFYSFYYNNKLYLIKK